MEMEQEKNYSKLYSDTVNPLFIKQMILKFGDKQWSQALFQDILSLAAAKIEDKEYLSKNIGEMKEHISNGIKKIQQSCIDRYVKPREKIMDKEQLSKQIKYTLLREKPKKDKFKVKIMNNRLFSYPKFKQLKKEVREEFQQFFRERHPLVQPIDFEQLTKMIKE